MDLEFMMHAPHLPKAEPEFASTVIRFPALPPAPGTGIRYGETLQARLERLLTWCRARWGREATPDNPQGCWCWSWLDATSLVVTLPGPELIFELELVEPWKSP